MILFQIKINKLFIKKNAVIEKRRGIFCHKRQTLALCCKTGQLQVLFYFLSEREKTLYI